MKLNATIHLTLTPAVLVLVACAPQTHEEDHSTAEQQAAAGPIAELAATDTGDAAMTDKATQTLKTAFETHKDNASHKERVIITFSDEAGDAELSSLAGVEVLNRMQNLPMAVAVIDARGLQSLEANPAIKRIEPDGEMHAQTE